jgi:hypothetical protein
VGAGAVCGGGLIMAETTADAILTMQDAFAARFGFILFLPFAELMNNCTMKSSVETIRNKIFAPSV